MTITASDPIAAELPPRRAGLAVAFAIGALLLLGLLAYQLRASYREARDAAVTDARNLALVLESKLRHHLLVARRTIEQIAADVDPEALRPHAARQHRERIAARLRLVARLDPSMGPLHYADAAGEGLYSSSGEQLLLGPSEQAFLKSLREDRTSRVRFSEVVVGRRSGRPEMLAAAAIRDRDGVVAGSALIAIDVATMREQFRALELGREGAVSMRRLDNGAMVVRYPGPLLDNHPKADLPIQKILLQDSTPGVREVLSPIDGITRTYAYRPVGDLPFYVVVGISDADALGEWRRGAMLSVGAAFLFLGLLGAFFVRLAGAERRRENAMALLQTSRRSLQEAHEIARLGSYSFDIPGDRWTSNDILDAIFGIDADYPRSVQHWLELVAPQDRAGMQAYLASIMRERQDFDREYRIVRQRDRRLRWVHGRGKFQYDARGEPVLLQGVIQDITERKEREAEIRRLAFYDPLTQLPNRQLLLDRLRHALAAGARSGRQPALLMLDLDNFKTLNESLGHDVGDLLLQQIAQRLGGCVRESDTVARLGGDEFVIVLEDLDGRAPEAAAQAELAGRKILEAAGSTSQLGEYEYHCTASIGIALPADRMDTPEDLLKRAELAMYQAKAAGGNTLRQFDPGMQAAVSNRAALEAELREALARGQLELHYQPQADRGGRLTGAEALLRWRHPQRGMVPPLEFIGLAEDNGLIVPLGLWVLQTACRQLAEWAAQPALAGMCLAVNISARQMHNGEFVEQVLGALRDSGAPPAKLKLELTESLLVQDVEGVIAKMNALKAHGVGFSLDDFGTGYSSLSYLKRLPLDELKIDRAFVRDILVDPDDAAIARMIIALAGSLGLTVVAEGVETEAQKEFLAREGCHHYQGYLLSRPLPPDAFVRFAGGESSLP